MSTQGPKLDKCHTSSAPVKRVRAVAPTVIAVGLKPGVIMQVSSNDETSAAEAALEKNMSIKAFDLDGDGKIDESEMLAGMMTMMAQTMMLRMRRQRFPPRLLTS